MEEQSFERDLKSPSFDTTKSAPKPRRQRASRIANEEVSAVAKPRRSEIGRVRWVSGIKPETLNDGKDLVKPVKAELCEVEARHILDAIYEDLFNSICEHDSDEP